jgi:putative restriction endonuclease
LAYWWVNQNQTFAHEFGDGYLWSPKTRADGARNQFYENMLHVAPGDIVFSYNNTYVAHIGVATSRAYESEKPKQFGSAGSNWSNIGWKVDVVYSRVKNPIRPKELMSQIGPLLPTKYSPLQLNGNGIQSVYLAGLTDELGLLLLTLTQAEVPAMQFATLDELTALDVEEQEIIGLANLDATVKATLVSARRGQGLFRARVQSIETECRVTGVRAEKFLIASHIKPWSGSTDQERLNGNNGLFLSPHVDKLFDKGFISFAKNGEMLVSPQLDIEVLEKWSIDPTKKYGKFNGDQAYFLAHHNNEIFKAEAA